MSLVTQHRLVVDHRVLNRLNVLIKILSVFCLFREINSFSLCFKIGNLSAAGKSAAKRSAGNEGSKSGSPAQPERQTSVHTVQVQPLDDVTFKLNEKNDPKSLLNKV